MLHSVSQLLASHCCSEMENFELAIETNLLKASQYLQQGHAALRYRLLMLMCTLCVFTCLCLYSVLPLTILTILMSSFSSEMAVSCMVLLQTSPLITRQSIHDSQKPVSDLPHPRTRNKQVACLYKLVTESLSTSCVINKTSNNPNGTANNLKDLGVSLYDACMCFILNHRIPKFAACQTLCLETVPENLRSVRELEFLCGCVADWLWSTA